MVEGCLNHYFLLILTLGLRTENKKIQNLARPTVVGSGFK